VVRPASPKFWAFSWRSRGRGSVTIEAARGAKVAEMRADVVRYLIQVIGVRTRNAHEAWRVLPSTVIIYGEVPREGVSLETPR
jgi:hypothetical protein